jgi:CRP/FNR family cyclic AMP-dependent transcriptional regulator
MVPPMPSRAPLPQGLSQALLSDPWFRTCPASLQEAVLAHSVLRPLQPGVSLFERGTPAEGLCCVVAGALRIGAVRADGSESMLAYLEPYQWFGEISLIDGLPRTHDAVADGATSVLVVSREGLLERLAAEPALWRDIARLACSKLRTVFDVLDEVGQLPLEQRLGRRLWMLAQGYGTRSDAPRRSIRLAQEQLALMLGVSRQSAHKALHALETRGLIRVHYGEIELVDLDGLRQAAGR